MKAGLLIVASLAYGFISVEEYRYATLFTLFVPILLGLVYFVICRVDWPPRLAPWLFACVALGKVAGHWRLNVQFGRVGPLVDGPAWGFAGVAAFFFALELRRAKKIREDTSRSSKQLSP
jgi:hypothetical protein